MQTQTQSAAAPTKCGLKLNYESFKFAIEKALTLKPRVQYLSLHDALVASSTGKSDCYVTFELFEDGLWVMCSCQFRADKRDYPKACFHIAAAALDRNLFAVPQPIGALVEEKRLDSLAYDALHRADQHLQKQDRFRPSKQQIQTMLDYIRRDATPYDFFVVKFGQHAFESLYNAGLIGLDGELVYAID